MQLLNFTIIKLTICLVIGILLGYYIDINIPFLLSICIGILLLVSFDVFILKNSYKNRFWIGLAIYLACICCGFLTISTHNEFNFKNHYTKLYKSEQDTIVPITFRIREVLKPGNFYNKYVIDILKFNDTIVSGRSLLNVEKDSTRNVLKVDDVLLTKTQFKDLIPPLNPHQFDYKAYLKKQHIYHQIFITSNKLYTISTKKHTLFGYASLLRETINKKFEKFNFKQDEIAIINALLLGQRQDISKDIYDSYTQAGAIHILAVSGLHVGIILLLLNFLFKPIEHLKNGLIIKTVIVQKAHE